MEMDPNPPSFNLQYNVQPMNIGEGYAAGISQAGQALASGVSNVMDVMNRNRTADDTLTAMNKSGMLGNDQFQAVANKSLGAKEQMLGMYAGQWIAQQAQNRDLQKIGYTGNVDVAAAHAKLLDTISAVKSGYGAAVGVQPGKLVVTPQTASGATAQSAPVLAPLQGSGNPPLRTNLSGTAAAPTPLGTDVTNPPIVNTPQLVAAQAQRAQQPVTVGQPLGGKPVPPGARIGTLNGQRGAFDPGTNTFYPLK